MDPVKTLVSWFSCLFHGLLTLFLIAVSALALATNPRELNLPVLPWTGSTLTDVVFFAALFGLATVLLAIVHKARILFLIWTAVVFVFLLKGYLFSAYRFANGSMSTAVWLIVLSGIAVAGGWFQWRAPRSNRFKY